MTSIKVTPAEVTILAYLAEFPRLTRSEVDELLAQLGPDAREIGNVLLQRGEGGEDAKRIAKAIRMWRNSLVHIEPGRRPSRPSSRSRRASRRRLAGTR